MGANVNILTGELTITPGASTGATQSFFAAVEWSPNHTLADGTRYLAGDMVYYQGNIYKANYDNESMPVSNTTYWQNLGTGYRLNIDGRDIPNTTFPTTQDLTFGTNKGVILEAPNGNKYKITVSNAGALITTQVTP